MNNQTEKLRVLGVLGSATGTSLYRSCDLAPLMRAIHGAHPEGRAEARPILFLTKLCVEFLINQIFL
ncbi:MAG: hypothetical protein A3E57_03515 [Candidatus Muproteobacteria bacterium RIFCSPHIGHO2_12_FULL_60_33]|nr:MAG: hypothetical protein A2W42_03430 [Candidatus Muproteobacteria bacterium RIFCSPHIGHO2_01_60_12]OGI54200.1 MAG: hypothetical protein A3E57_03515 [Candidatus Muproteobacteria bacterium RIFCSPHIGHO2_12_FULL_60_33]OGI55010.1 MAG: hypothetical protein A3D32_02945 [Candidatus Muproteobacteria bacterium RIFCSPHIGHO2_02_FULL_60_13]